MSYVVPNNRLVIYKDVPIERNYQHSLYFTNITAQTTYFSNANRIKYSFNDLTRIRITTPGRKIRVPININNLYDCNYLAITNSATSEKTFYCFIDNVEYVNESVSEISYTIDVIQTWLFQFSSGGVINNMCFVEREHVRNDVVGANLVSENLNTGDLISGTPYPDPNFSNPRLVLVSTGDLNSAGAIIPASGMFYNGTYHQIDLGVYQIDSQHIADTITAIQNKLNEMSIFMNTNTIINFLMIPNAFIPTGTISWTNSVTNSYVGTVTPGFTPTQGSYTPKNNKLLTYPYSFFTLDNHEGTIEEFKYELFKNGTAQFYEYCDFSPQPSVAIVPNGYNQPDAQGNLDFEMTKAIKFSSFPKCSWAVNDLGAKFVQAGIGMAIGAMTRGIYVGSPASEWTANNHPYNTPYAGDVPLLNENKQIQSYQRQFMEMPYNENVNIPGSKFGFRLKPLGALTLGALSRGLLTTNIKSFTGNGNINLPMGELGFEFRQHYLRPEIAKIIDDYFTMYGYAVNELKYPNIHNRKYWTYLKTNGCTISAGIPNDDADAICDIFDNGITFWDVASGAEVGNYSMNNQTLSS